MTNEEVTLNPNNSVKSDDQQAVPVVAAMAKYQRQPKSSLKSKDINQWIEDKRKRNREAAARCRDRKMQRIAELEKQVQALSELNKAQEARIQILKEEIQQLQHVKNH